MKKELTFKSNGLGLSAWLFMPEKTDPPVPCIIMAHGFGGTREARLEPYALRFHEQGFAVLIFDYRHFGESQGEPRQLLSIPDQLDDWAAALTFVRTLEGIDINRIALWGTSLSGGHVIMAAAKDGNVACVSAQCPMLDGRAAGLATLRRSGVGFSLRLLMHAQRDMIRSFLGLSPHRIPIVGPPDSIAFLNTPNADERFGDIAPEDFCNEICARVALRMDKYRPIKSATKVRCPTLIQICDKDDLAPAKVAEKTGRIMGSLAEVKHYPIDHFDIYLGDDFQQSVSDQLDFFKHHLGPN